MVTSTRANFSKESGMEKEKFCSQTQQYKRVYGWKTKSNDFIEFDKIAKYMKIKRKKAQRATLIKMIKLIYQK